MADGSAQNCKVLESVRGLDEAGLLGELMSERYAPALLDGKPVNVRFVFNFEIAPDPGSEAPKKK